MHLVEGGVRSQPLYTLLHIMTLYDTLVRSQQYFTLVPITVGTRNFWPKASWGDMLHSVAAVTDM